MKPFLSLAEIHSWQILYIRCYSLKLGHPTYVARSPSLFQRVLNYDDWKLFIIRDIDKLTECRRQKTRKNIYIFSPSLFSFKDRIFT